MIRTVAAVLAVALAGCPVNRSTAPPLHPSTAPSPSPPPAVLAEPSWVLLLRPAVLLGAPAVRTMTRGLGIDQAVDDFVAGAAFDLEGLGTVRIESDGEHSLFVVPAAEAPHLVEALTLQQLRAGAGGGGSPEDDLQVVTETAGDWAVVYRALAPPPPEGAFLPRADDPEADRLARLLRRVDDAAAVFLVRGPFDVRPDLDPSTLLARTEAIGCAARPEGADKLRLGCVLFGVRGDDLTAATLQLLVATVFDSTLGMILDLENAAAEQLFDPEPGAAYAEALLDVRKLIPGLEVLASVPLAHLLGTESTEEQEGGN